MIQTSHKSFKVQETQKAILWAITTAFALFSIKTVTAFFTHSMAILALALDSLLDVISSSVNLFASIKAAKPPDEEHTYGHEKIESLASLFQSILIGFSGFWLMIESTKRLIYGTSLYHIPAGIGIMIISMILTLLLTFRLEAAQKKYQSLILSTEKLHYTMDVLTHGGTIATLLIVQATRVSAVDLFFSITISLYIFKTAYGIFKKAVDELLDRSLPPVSKEEIENLIRNHHPAIINFHNFRSRRVGAQIFMDFHIEIRGEENFEKAHNLTESLIAQICKQYPGADVTVHYDPEGAA